MSRLRGELRIYYADEGRAEQIRFAVRRYRVRFRTRAPTRARVQDLESDALPLARASELLLKPDAREIPIVADVADRSAQDFRRLF